MNMLKMCLNWKVVAALAAVGFGVALVAPDVLGAALPLLILAACPLSMVIMMGAMGGMKGKRGAAGSEQEHAPADTGGHGEQLADLKAQLLNVQIEQATLARAIAELESGAAGTAGTLQLQGKR